MTWRIIRTLMIKDLLRYAHNRPSMVLAVLLVLIALLTSIGRSRGLLGGDDMPVVCHVLYWNDDPFIDDLREHPPNDFTLHLAPAVDYVNRQGLIVYPSPHPRELTTSIQIRPGNARESAGWPILRDSEGRGPDDGPRDNPSPRATPGGPSFAPAKDGVTMMQRSVPDAASNSESPATPSPRYDIWYWHPHGRPDAIFAPRDWFNARLRAFHHNTPAITETHAEIGGLATPGKPFHRILTGMTLVALYLVCFHLHILITSEERERKTLLAQMLTPMTVADLLASKVALHVPVALALAAIVLSLNEPAALTRPILWAGLVAGAVGYLAIGLVICSLTRTQSAAGLCALAYLMLVGVVIYLASMIPLFSLVAGSLIDYHLIQITRACLMDDPPQWISLHLAALIALALGWSYLAIRLIKRREA